MLHGSLVLSLVAQFVNESSQAQWIYNAAQHGSLENMEWLYENGCRIDSPVNFLLAAIHGSLDTLRWLMSVAGERS